MNKIYLVLLLLTSPVFASDVENEVMVTVDTEYIKYRGYEPSNERLKTLHIDYNMVLGETLIINLGASKGFGEVTEDNPSGGVLSNDQTYKSYRVGFGVRF